MKRAIVMIAMILTIGSFACLWVAIIQQELRIFELKERIEQLEQERAEDVTLQAHNEQR